MRHARIACGVRQIHVLACEGGFERMRGLLKRPEPDPGVALLLDPCWAVHTLGMRYPIDVVFCDARWRVLRVVPALRPRRVAWVRGASRVLEFGANTARPLGIVTGVRLQPEATLLSSEAFRKNGGSAAASFGSAPIRALAGLATVTLLAALLLGGCASTAVPSRAPDSGTRVATSPRSELRLQAEIDYTSRAWLLAETAYRALIQLEPRDAEHWRRLGVVFLRTDRASEAVDALSAAARLQVPDSRTLQNLALAHLRAAADALERAASAPDTDGPTASARGPARPAAASRKTARASAAPTATPDAATPQAAPPNAAPPNAAPRDSLQATVRAVEALLPEELRRSGRSPTR